MKHIHLATCESTQDILLKTIENGEKDTSLLVSCDEQTRGYGQYGRSFEAGSGSLCFSFIYPPHEVLTLTTLEVSVLVVRFFENQYLKKLFFKWPNDILNSEGKKVGGIIARKVNDSLVMGVGLNFYGMKSEFEFPAGNIFAEEVKMNKKNLSASIYQYLMTRRESIDVIEDWTKRCFHKNQTVYWKEDGKDFSGEFQGVNPEGAALIKCDGVIKTLFSGTLKFNQ